MQTNYKWGPWAQKWSDYSQYKARERSTKGSLENKVNQGDDIRSQHCWASSYSPLSQWEFCQWCQWQDRASSSFRCGHSETFPTWGRQSLPVGSPVRYRVLIGSVIWTPAAWLHLLRWTLPLPGTQKLTETGLSLQAWMRDVWQRLLKTQGLSHCPEMHTYPQSSPMPGAHLCASSIPLPLTSCMVHRAEAHGVGKSPLPTPAVWRQKHYRHLTSYSLKISTSRGDTSHKSSGATLHHENKTAEHGPIPVENVESLALSVSHGRLNIYLIGKGQKVILNSEVKNVCKVLWRQKVLFKCLLLPSLRYSGCC